jgi:type I restriction enzyme S subunit
MQVDQIPSGYKLTDVGIIPSDWDVVKLPEICWFQEGPGLRNWQFTNRGIKVINVTNLENGYLNLDKTDRYISLEEFNKMYQHFSIDDQDIVMASSGNSYSKVATVRKKDLPLLMNTSVIRFKPLKDINYKYLLMFLNSYVFKDQIDILITGGAQPNFGPVHLKKIHVPLPPIEEQKRIAQVLSDIDELIRSLDELIIKKRNIKQGTMQLLLTGKQRLPGYSGEWEVKKLPEVCWFQEGPGLRNWQFTNRGIKVINITNLEKGYLNLDKTDRYISLEEFNKMYKHFEIDEADIVMASSGNSYSKTSVVRKKDLPLLMNTSVIRFKPLENIDYSFVLLFLKSYLFKNQIDLLITGGAQPNFGPIHLKKIIISLPHLEEQKAIARILSDMDEEIEVLEQKRNKYQDIKKGMMQELLTGKTRLV